jgi:hypothetical protein
MLPEQSRQNKYSSLIKRLADIIHSARTIAVRQINKAQVLAYYEIGREIVEFEQKGKARAGYGEELIKRLSRDMMEKFGRGFSTTNLKMMRLFYHAFPIRQTVSDESLTFEKSSIPQTASAKFEPMLSWSHYCELLSVENPLARSFYFKGNEMIEGENEPIGLILCARKDEVFARYVLGNLNNKIFASKYKLALPSEKELVRKIKSLHLLEEK